MSQRTSHAHKPSTSPQVLDSQFAHAGPSGQHSLLRDGSIDSSLLTPLPSEANVKVYVELRTLKSEERKLYTRDFSERPMTDEEAFPEYTLKAVVGEAVVGKESYYFVKLVNNQVFKFAADRFAREHHHLVETYRQKKRRHELEPFDPTASYVHPTSRLAAEADVAQRRRSPNALADSDGSAREYATSESEGDEDAYEEASDTLAARRSSRPATKNTHSKQLPLPFSPKKTRAKKAPDYSSVLVEDSDDELALSMSPAFRRSNRSRKTTRRKADDEDFGDNSDASELSPRPKQKILRRKGARPAYGRFRPVNAIDYDSDEDTAVLRAHRGDCAKCGGLPAHVQRENLRKMKPKKRKARRNEDEFEDDDDEETKITKLGGWVRCLRCPVVAHWNCLAKVQRDEILKAANEKARAEWLASKPSDEDTEGLDRHKIQEPVKKTELGLLETTEFICGSCTRGGICYCCKEVAVEEEGVVPKQTSQANGSSNGIDGSGDVEMADAATKGDTQDEKSSVVDELLFRCSLCKRLAHYAHLPPPPEDPEGEYSAIDLAEHYQYNTGWQCADCFSFVYSVETILAWRPYPEKAVESKSPHYKDPLPREYLVKWVDRSYRRVQWVPHMWLLATSPAKLKNFLERGSPVALLPEPVAEANVEGGEVDDPVSTFGVGAEEHISETPSEDGTSSGSPDAVPDAERRIQPAWKTVDRVLDILLWRPEKRFKDRKRGKAQVSRTESDSEVEDAKQEREAAYDLGEQPSADLVETVDAYCRRTKMPLSVDDVDRVVWAFFKWKDLGYDNASWDSPPRPGTPAYAAFVSAFEHFIKAREVRVRLLTQQEEKAYASLPFDLFRRKYAFTIHSPPQLGQSDQFKLMPFQIEGVNWLCNNWWNRQHCILADEMGLGKTVQIVTFIGQIVKGIKQSYSACPVLVVVPNSTITNWVREFERWAPDLRVVPFYGESKSREIIKQYELYHEAAPKRTTRAKYHVLVTTYETITTARESMAVFKSTPRWEALVVDEGQRLKSDSSLLFKKLRELNTVHRIILTGTPLNNNIRELFNLMNFLDPRDWNNLHALEKEYEELTEEKIKQLHERLRPYFLRRVKSEVLQLPPKNEVIVPISMAPLQKETYKSILTKNLKALQSIASAAGTKVNAAASKSNMNNMLMQLRKCIQHPYLTAPEMENMELPSRERHEKLVSASSKLNMLRALLPKLKSRGHRVLLFSQFVIALDIIEDFLRGEGMKYLRLDGNTKQATRQKDMDQFNKPDSDIFIYILSTRAGGVGINLWSADTVIIFDPDFNPHQDLQAIARAHRYGQQKTCLVFKFMMKDSAEERIMQAGKKKLVLDHLIVQKMDDDEKDVQSILTFGAQALFETDGASTRDIHYSEHDIDKLIEKTETEGDEQEMTTSEGAAFSFAKIWSADKDALEELDTGDAAKEDQENAWAQTLQRIAEERAKAELVEATGRGTRRKAAPVFPQQYVYDDSPPKNKKGKGKAKVVEQVDDDAYALSEIESARSSASSAGGGVETDLATLADNMAKKAALSAQLARGPSPPRKVLYPAPQPAPRVEDLPCGLCGLTHSDRPCFMIESSENLVEYRNILMNHAGDESIEDRRAAIAVIDETLHSRGQMHLVFGQPLHPVENVSKSSAARRAPQGPSPHHNPAVNLNGNSKVPHSRPNPTPIPRPTAMAGPSKRPSSPLHDVERSSKKMKSNDEPICVLCSQSPGHKLKKCPVVAQGSQRIAQEMRRLQSDPAHALTMEKLSRLHFKYKQRELLAASAVGA